MQGRLSDRRDAAAAGGALDENELAYAVALSVISCPGAQNIWRLIRTHGPSEVYRMVSRIAQPAPHSAL
jgi:hypothetical protein